MISWNKIAIFIVCILCAPHIHAQTISYYQLTKVRIDGKESLQNSGGQFICIYDDFCFDCDINGKGVNNGQLHLKSRGEYIVYIGESFFGKNTYYKFNSSLSKLNIITPDGDIYAYKRATPPSNTTTCSLIKGKVNSSSSFINTTSYAGYNLTGYNETNVNENTDAPRQKTKVRRQCAHCGGEGEYIQHEYVSTFGLDGPSVYCNICNKSWSYGTVHAHHKCTHCKGTGYYEYEY